MAGGIRPLNDPPSTPLVLVILPVGHYPFLEESVVTTNPKLASGLHIVVDLPEVFNGVHGGEIDLILLPAAVLVVPEIPERPGIFQRMLHLRDVPGNPQGNVVFNGFQFSTRSNVPFLGSFLVDAVVFNAPGIGHFEGIFLHPGVVSPAGRAAVIPRGGIAALLIGVVDSHILICDKIEVRFLFSFILGLLWRSYHHLLFLIIVLEIGVGHHNNLGGLVQDQSVVEQLAHRVISGKLSFFP